MRNHIGRVLGFCLTALFLTVLVTVPIAVADVDVSAMVPFELVDAFTASKYYLHFATNVTFANATYTNASFVGFTNFYIAGDQTDSWGLSLSGSNVTVSEFDLNNDISYTVVSTGTQNWVTNKRPLQVTFNGVATTSYSYGSGILSIVGAPAGSTIVASFYATSTITPTDYYFLSYTHTVLNVTGYSTSEQSGWVYATASQVFAGAGTVDYGFRVWILHSDSQDPTNVVGASGPDAIITRGSVGSGMQSASVYVTNQTIVIGMNALKITMYVRFNGGDWVAMATCVSDLLIEKGINAGVWEFNLYTQVSFDGGYTTASALWGDQTRTSGIAGVEFVTPLPQEIALWKGIGGDWVGMIMYPYVYVMLDMFYGLILLFVGGNMYLRYRRFEIFLILFLIWGSTSGLGTIIPVAAYRVIYIIALLGIASLLYRQFR